MRLLTTYSLQRVAYCMLTLAIAASDTHGQKLDPLDGTDMSPECAYSDHSNLLVVRDASGGERPVRSKEDWALRVSHIKANMQRVMGPLPDVSKKSALRVKVLSSDSVGKYQRQEILFSPDESDRVPAWLLIPHEAINDGRTPAMLCLHQTIPIGKDEPVGLGGRESLHYARELAERGYVCIVPDYPSFGKYQCDFKTAGTSYGSGTMKAIWNNMRAVDVLESLPQVDKSRIGAIGHSLGGHNSLFTAVFDDRIKAVVTSCGFTPFHDYYQGNLKGWTSDRYMPRIRDVYENDPDKVPFDFYEIVAALAPRGLYSNSPLYDSNFEVSGVRKVFEKANAVYALFETDLTSPKALRLETPSSQHDFPELERTHAYEWLDEVLR